MNFFDNQLIYALGWTIVHSFWQCLLVFALLKLCLLLSKRAHAEMRYGLAAVALLCCLLISLKTFINCYQDVVEASLMLSQIQQAIGITYAQTWWTRIFQTINPWLEVIVLLWSLGFILQACRYSVDLLITQRLKHQGTEVLPEIWYQRFLVLQRQLGLVKRIQFLQSARVQVPCIIGHFKPVVLLPLGLISQLPQAQVEAIVLHELAHIRRHDYLVNILQCLLKILFFFNPFVYAICKVMDLERENACDDLAVQTCGDPIAFAHSLSQFTQTKVESDVALTINKSKWLLLARVQRLFMRPSSLSYATERLLTLCCIGLLGLTLSVHATTQTTSITSSEFPESPQALIVDSDKVPDPALSQTDEPVKKANIAAAVLENSVVVVHQQEDKSQLTEEIKQVIPALSEGKVVESSRAPSSALSAKETSVASQMMQTAAADYVADVETKKPVENPVPKKVLEVKKDSKPINLTEFKTKAFFYLIAAEPAHFLPFTHIVFAPLDVNELEVESTQTRWLNTTKNYLAQFKQKGFIVMRLEDNKVLAPEDYPDANSPTLVAQFRFRSINIGPNSYPITLGYNGLWKNGDLARDQWITAEDYNLTASGMVEIVLIHPISKQVLFYGEMGISNSTKRLGYKINLEEWQSGPEAKFWIEVIDNLQWRVSDAIHQIKSQNIPASKITPQDFSVSKK